MIGARFASAIVAFAALTGAFAPTASFAASQAASPMRAERDPIDPWEPFNRRVYQFNDALDGALLKPAAKAYVHVVPEPLRFMVSNVFANLTDIWTLANQVMQGKPDLALQDLARVTLNTTFGLAGVADIATPLGFERHREDFGQTLGTWGFEQGPYLVLPVFGPSGVRDGLGFGLDLYVYPVKRIGDVPTRNTAQALRFVDRRAALLPAEGILDRVALDEYTFVRDAYLHRRYNLLHDGNPPTEPEDDYDDDAGAGAK